MKTTTKSQSEKTEDNGPLISHKTIAVIQMTRIGDIVQTYQACKKFKEDFPEFRLILITRKTFSGQLHYLIKDTFDKIYEIDFRDIFNSKDITLSKAKSNLDRCLGELFNENIVLSANFTYSKSANYLNAILPSTIKLGPYYNNRSLLMIEDTWSQLANASILTGRLNPFSLVDIFRLSLGKKNSDKVIKNPTDNKPVKKIVLHPFASTEKKCWKPEKWVDFIYKTLKDNREIKIYLVGSKEEREASFKIINSPYLEGYKNRLINFVGNLKLNEVSELLKNSDLFVGHDSSIGHLASVAQTKTVTIALGDVRVHETTPYGIGNVVLTPRRTESSDVSHLSLNLIVNQIIQNKSITKEFVNEEKNRAGLASCDIYLTKISKSDTLQLVNLVNSNESLENIFREFYRISWLFTISGQDDASSIPSISEDTYAHLHIYLNGVQQLFDISVLGKKYCKYILEEIASQTPSLEKIKSYSTQIDNLGGLEKTVLVKFSYLRPIVDFYALSRANSKGSNLVELTHNTYNAYEDLGYVCGIIYDLAEKTLVEHNIKKGKGTSLQNEI